MPFFVTISWKFSIEEEEGKVGGVEEEEEEEGPQEGLIRSARLLSSHLIISAPFLGSSGRGGLARKKCATTPLCGSDWSRIKLNVCPAFTVQYTAAQRLPGAFVDPLDA